MCCCPKARSSDPPLGSATGKGWSDTLLMLDKQRAARFVICPSNADHATLEAMLAIAGIARVRPAWQTVADEYILRRLRR